MADSFFFYDLETSGLNAVHDRIMQFAGQRTDANLQPIGEPVNLMIRLPGDVLPSPDAIMITGITPQSTLQDGLTEAEFLRYFYDEIVQPNTTFLGYNTVRFDDEFMRTLHYRNFYDPYEWQWANGCSRWDILDVVRMTRALRPDGINWPTTPDGKPTNRLELLTKVNGLDHEHAHDALNDVMATIAVARLIRDKQPDLFKYLYDHRGKKAVAELVEAGQPFVYASGKYPSSYLHTTAAVLLTAGEHDSALVYNLRTDPTPFLSMSPAELADIWRYKKDRSPDDPVMPVKTVKYNRCPAVAPLGVIKDEATQKRLGLDMATIERNWSLLKKQQKAFATTILQAVALLDEERAAARPTPKPTIETVDSLLYDGFVGPADKQTMRAVRAADPADIIDVAQKCTDQRLLLMAPLYKARNYPAALSAEERQVWDEHVTARLFTGGQRSPLARYFARLQQLAAGTPSTEQGYLLEELQLYGESLMPSDITEPAQE